MATSRWPSHPSAHPRPDARTGHRRADSRPPPTCTPQGVLIEAIAGRASAAGSPAPPPSHTATWRRPTSARDYAACGPRPRCGRPGDGRIRPAVPDRRGDAFRTRRPRLCGRGGARRRDLTARHVPAAVARRGRRRCCRGWGDRPRRRQRSAGCVALDGSRGADDHRRRDDGRPDDTDHDDHRGADHASHCAPDGTGEGADAGRGRHLPPLVDVAPVMFGERPTRRREPQQIAERGRGRDAERLQERVAEWRRTARCRVPAAAMIEAVLADYPRKTSATTTDQRRTR